MTIKEFCLYHTKVNELVAIVDSGYVVATVWIDYEDLFHIHEKLMNKEVKNHYWNTLSVTDVNGNCVEIPCHYVEIEN